MRSKTKNRMICLFCSFTETLHFPPLSFKVKRDIDFFFYFSFSPLIFLYYTHKKTTKQKHTYNDRKECSCICARCTLPCRRTGKRKQILMTTIIDKMLYAPRDEVALVLSGTNDTLNPLHTQSNGARYQHITVCNPLCAATTDCLQPLYNLEELARHSDKGKSDFLDTLIVCLALLHDHIGTKKYKRVVYLITDAREEVARREELNEVSQSLRADDVTLVVVGVDFTETSSDMSDFTSLSIKAQNERVLHFLCSSVGNASQVLSVEDTLQGVSQLRARKILQRPLLKVVLTIGDIRLAVQMFSKAQEEKFPTLKRVTTDGVGVGMASEYVRVGGEEHQGPIQPGDHVKAFRYGRGLIPCTEADLDAMKLHGLRSLEAVAFVPREEVPPYILMGGVKAILPLAGDHTGQKGFACIVRSMLELNRVLIVRHVRTRDAAPSLAVCFPSDQDGDCLYFAPLPFSEDVRPFRFSNYEEVQCTAAEERMIDNMIDALTVEETVLMPSETFNPSLQQYYGTLRSKLMSKEESDVPPLLPTLQASSTAFNAFGNPLQPVLEKALPVLDKVAAAFPFAEVDPGQGGRPAQPLVPSFFWRHSGRPRRQLHE
ncbi:ATP-dependent DNA helicase 2 subunit 2 [Angomonas deanei]|nr:ATP-dependent DNA helicase 2 subunit 2 [Angomonas deanei]|eukprot:EPY42233.1 ATP-dependent DNA helicase 2 subunit 2 [Angomonas deanei]